MTAEEAITLIERSVPIIAVTEEGFSEHREAVTMACEALEKQNKYRWHDLRKNPDDLPKASELVEVKFETGNYNHGIYDYYDECFAYRNVSKKDLHSKVIAWRYIEPFEGGE